MHEWFAFCAYSTQSFCKLRHHPVRRDHTRQDLCPVRGIRVWCGPAGSLQRRRGLDSSLLGLLCGWLSSNEAPNPNGTFQLLCDLTEVGSVIWLRNGWTEIMYDIIRRDAFVMSQNSNSILCQLNKQKPATCTVNLLRNWHKFDLVCEGNAVLGPPSKTQPESGTYWSGLVFCFVHSRLLDRELVSPSARLLVF